MEDTERQADEKEQAADELPMPSYGLLYITRAYNRKEITFEEWLRQSRVWAEAMIGQHGKEKPHGHS
jgi:hypothetical protein